MDNTKHWIFSKTIFFGSAQIVFALVGMTMGWLSTTDGAALLMLGLSTVGLRFNTTQPISGFDK